MDTVHPYLGDIEKNLCPGGQSYAYFAKGTWNANSSSNGFAGDNDVWLRFLDESETSELFSIGGDGDYQSSGIDLAEWEQSIAVKCIPKLEESSCYISFFDGAMSGLTVEEYKVGVHLDKNTFVDYRLPEPTDLVFADSVVVTAFDAPLIFVMPAAIASVTFVVVVRAGLDVRSPTLLFSKIAAVLTVFYNLKATATE